MRTSCLTIMALVIALASGSAAADFVLIFDDPATTEVEVRIVDQEAGDFNISGAIAFVVRDNSDGLGGWTPGTSAKRIVLSIRRAR